MILVSKSTVAVLGKDGHNGRRRSFYLGAIGAQKTVNRLPRQEDSN